LHIEKEDGYVEHREFLADGKEDPRIKLLKQMKTELKIKFPDSIKKELSFYQNSLRELQTIPTNNIYWIHSALLIKISSILENWLTEKLTFEFSSSIIENSKSSFTLEPKEITNGIILALISHERFKIISHVRKVAKAYKYKPSSQTVKISVDFSKKTVITLTAEQLAST
jgi:hypothetical protein